jgi:lysophospholipase L1-like esterase
VLAQNLTDAGLPVEVVANPSVTGATSAQMLQTGIGPIRSARPDVMTVMLGVNDQVQGRTTEQFEVDEDRALREAIAITGSPNRVIAVDIPDYSVTPVGAQFGAPAQIADQIDAFNAVVKRVAARRKVELVSIVDISRRLGSGGISSDGLHPSAAQLVAWADRVAPVARRQWRGLEPTAR